MSILVVTAPFVDRDKQRPEEVESSGADHALDAMRYGVHPSNGPELSR